MVNIKELRVGNLLQYQSEIFRLDTVQEIPSLTWIRKNASYIKQLSLDDLNPITLTPEILESCGFKKDGDCIETVDLGEDNDLEITVTSDIYELDIGHKSFRIQLSTTSIIFRFDIGCDWTDSTESPEYLHQLQNLYFALTGEELKIKELQHA